MPTTESDLANLTLLGRDAKPSKQLETFPNHDPGRRYTVTLTTDEFTCVLQPDLRGEQASQLGYPVEVSLQELLLIVR